ncbi:unnamed protein product, partial [Soboliphyme baturini]|uniref:Transposase n=1 Tax=Soboliphyme baturini TaxID=241478 RepID=A0A183J7C9_9BILA
GAAGDIRRHGATRHGATRHDATRQFVRSRRSKEALSPIKKAGTSATANQGVDKP